MRRVFRAFALGLVASPCSVCAATRRMRGSRAGLVKDINTTTTTLSGSNLTAVGSLLFFTASDATNGMELWKNRRYSQRHRLVQDILRGLRFGREQPHER
jgi:ELWxxDGT repeat protein